MPPPPALKLKRSRAVYRDLNLLGRQVVTPNSSRECHFGPCHIPFADHLCDAR